MTRNPSDLVTWFAQRTHLWGVVLILLLATGLRFYHLEAQSFWNDEGNSARLSERPISLIIAGTASDIHPPFYYLLLHGWRGLVGESEFSLRAFSAFAGIGTVALTYALGQRWGGRWAAMAGGGLTAVSPALVYYSQETRMYALLALFATLSTWLLVCWLSGLGHRARWLLPGYTLAVAAGLYTHYVFPAVVLAHMFLLFSRFSKTRPQFVLWMISLGVAFCLYLPWLPIFLRQLGGGIPETRPPVAEFLAAVGQWLVFGATVQQSEVVGPLLAAGLLGGWGTAVSRYRLPLLLSLAAPLLFLYAAGSTDPAYFKFLVITIPPCTLLLVGWLPRNGRLTWVHILPLLGLGVMLWGNGRSLDNLYNHPTYARADYRSIVARIAAENHPNAAVILNAPNQWEVFTYYHHTSTPVYPLPKGRLDASNIETALTGIVAQHTRLYAIFWGETQRDPERLVERWLDSHTFKAREEWVGDVRFVTYAVPAVGAVEMETAVYLPFGPAITLNGYTLLADRLQPGDIVQVTLFWQTAEPLTQRYKLFLHLVDESGQPIAQRDSEPGGGLAITTTWQPGQEVVDNHGVFIPLEVANGRYTLLLGLYDIADATARLPITTPDGVVDAFPLAVITVEE